MRFQVISSGSKGNITYIESKETKILLDAGISIKEFNRRTTINLKEIEAIFITHEHSDHVSSLKSFLRLSSAILYITKESFEYLKEKDEKIFIGHTIKFVEANKKYVFKDITILTLQLSHDSANCLGYIFISKENNQNVSLGYITDTGFIPTPYMSVLSTVDSLIIEANHDIEMLFASNRPLELKKRICSPTGHLSNLLCGQILKKILVPKNIQKVILAHRSQDCNSEEQAIDTIYNVLDESYIPKFYIALQYESLELLEVKDEY